jgi:cytochrome c peroxidase
LTNPSFSPDLILLGEALFWDPEISGNRDISCATCHHSLFATGDGLSVSVGTLGRGLGNERTLAVRRRFIPRNAPPIFNLGYAEWKVMFWDGRVSGDLENGFESPASTRLPDGLHNLLAAQGMFPVTSREEMRGDFGDKDIFGKPNELATIPDWDVPAIWQAIMKRLLAIPAYQELFSSAYPDLQIEELGFEHAANALAAYQAAVFTFEDSPFDRYISGDLNALTEEQRNGAILFFGKAGCATCHAGGLLTDQRFHNMGVPLVGHGKGRERPLDLGRARETGNDCDRYAFRTPPLRNVALTGPWMHNGAFTTLEGAVRHHLEGAASLLAYDPAQLLPALQETCIEDPVILNEVLATLDEQSGEVALTDDEIHEIMIFLEAFTSPSALDLRHTIPTTVPSGLTVGGN